MSNPINYLLVGLPYSGKSTMAKYLEDNLGFSHINIDQLKWNRGYTNVGDDDVPDQVWDEIFLEADRILVDLLHSGKNVANEYAWITLDWRERTKKVATEAGFETIIIYIDISKEEVMKRWKDNLIKKDHFHWPEDEFKKILNDFEQPTNDEKVLRYDQSIPLEDWVKQNISH